MQAQDEAVEFFARPGIAASRRQWALGDTVMLPSKLQEPGPSRIAVYSFVAWLLPDGNGWDSLTLGTNAGVPSRLPFAP